VPELHFKGKEFVYNFHLSVPFRPLVPHPTKSVGKDSGNIIIHGDNLHALKALLPRFAGRVDCIFIDPPYNTGNENWNYNDNVNSPMLREWLDGNPVNKEDMLRHDKWLCMMYPRMKLLHELLSENGSLWMTLDDNEVHRARLMLDEVFGEDCCVGQLAWQKRTSRENRAVLSPSIDHILLYSKRLPDTWRLFRNLLEPAEEGYANPDNDPNGEWKSVPFTAQGRRTNQMYIITTPTGKALKPPKGRCWAATEPEFKELLARNLVYWPKEGDGRPRIKQYPEFAKGLVPDTLWLAVEVGDTEDSKKLLLEIFSDRQTLDFHAPKPHQLIQRVLEIATTKESLVLDSFAGTGSTAHAVLAQNARDGGTRRFILVECEDYADTLTAERVRRIISGYEFTGVQKEQLMQENVTWTKLSSGRQHQRLLDRVQAFENLEGHRFDRIVKAVNHGVLTVTGEKDVRKRTSGLKANFLYYTLGEPIDIDKILTGEQLPEYSTLGAWLFHTATGEPLNEQMVDKQAWYLGESAQYHVWLVYKPDLAFLKSRDSALTLSLAKTISGSHANKPHLVFASAKYVPNKMLLPLRVEHAPLPFALYRIEKS
jgi:adenine-specific DNA-methyltransferase